MIKILLIYMFISTVQSSRDKTKPMKQLQEKGGKKHVLHQEERRAQSSVLAANRYKTTSCSTKNSQVLSGKHRHSWKM